MHGICRNILRGGRIRRIRVLIEISHLTKSYGPNIAVNDLNLTLEPGNIYGFLGPNGAGKSTTMNIITGYIGASSGEVKINGYDINKNPEEAKRCIGYLPELPPVYGDMKVIEYLRFVAELKKIRKAEVNADIKQVMDLTKLHQMENRLIKNLSKGYRQRVGLAQALMGMPEIIIMDEPTVGLDPKQIIEVRDLIKSLRSKHTVVLSSHILQEISAVCDHVFIISRGEIVANDTLENLENNAKQGQKISIIAQGSEAAVKALSTLPSVSKVTIEESRDGIVKAALESAKGADARADVFSYCAENGPVLLEMKQDVKTLEDIFLELTKEKAVTA